METQYEYGSRCGVWRILRIFQKYARKFTCYAVGKAVEVNPGAILAMVKDGHEIASHNHRWIDYAIVDEDTERQHVRDCIDAIKKASGGIVPVGWYTGRVGVHSRRIVWDEYKKYTGKSLLYECDAYNDDLPYWVDMKEEDEEGLLVIPYTLDQNDMKFCVVSGKNTILHNLPTLLLPIISFQPPGFTDPSGFFNYLKNAFDVLYEEASTSAPHPTPKLMSVGLHCRLAGKPGRAAALDQFLKYLSTFGDDVWVATRQEIAEHWRREFPYIKK